jgi:signal transduction histidine kinase
VPKEGRRASRLATRAMLRSVTVSIQSVDARPTFIHLGTLIAIVVTTTLGLFQGILGQPSAAVVILISVVAVILGIATAGVFWAERRPSNRALHALLAAYAACALAAIWLSDGRARLIPMPLVSLLVLYLALPTAFVLNALLAAFVCGVLVRTLAEESVAQAIAGELSAFAFVIVFSLLARRERYARREVERLAAEVEALATSRERDRIAREIHDSLGHYLTVANVQLEAARSIAEGRDQRLSAVQQLLRDGLRELRLSVSMLREPSSARPPFAQAIAELVAEANATGLRSDLIASGLVRPLPGAIGFALYRVAEEALTNVRRHARATKAVVCLDYQPQRVRLSVVDDGVGPGDVPPVGMGLSGLRERVELLEGRLVLEAPSNGGFSVSVEMPA